METATRLGNAALFPGLIDSTKREGALPPFGSQDSHPTSALRLCSEAPAILTAESPAFGMCHAFGMRRASRRPGPIGPAR